MEGLFSAGIVLVTGHTMVNKTISIPKVNKQLHCGYVELGKLLDLPKSQFS